SQEEATVDPAAIRGWGPPDWPPSGACLTLGPSLPEGSLNAVEGDTIPGLRLFGCTVEHLLSWGAIARCPWPSGGHGDLFGDRPHTPNELTGHGHHDLVGVCASGEQFSVALAKSHLRLPADVLHNVGLLCESPLQVATPLGGIAVRPGPFNAGPPGLDV